MAMLNGVSSRSIEGIHTTHYYGDANTLSTFDHLIPEGAPFKNASIGIKPSFSWDNLCTAQTWQELMAYSVDYTELGDYLVFATANRKDAYLKEDLAKYGFVHNPDERMDRMDGWLAPKGMLEYVQPDPEIGLFEELQEHKPSYSRYSAMTDVNLSVKELFGTVPINKVGFYVSKIANLEQDLRDVIFTNYLREKPGYNPETEAFFDKLISKRSFSPREIEAIGVEDLENAIARTYYDEESAVLVAPKDIYQKLLNELRGCGIEGDEAVRIAKRAAWYHELFHTSDRRKLRTERGREIDDGEFLAEFFGERAGIVNEKLASHYKALAGYNRNYANRHKNLIRYLAEKYESEARNMGMDEAEAKDYAANRLEQDIEDMEKSDLEQEAEENPRSGKDKENKTETAKSNKEYSAKEMDSGDAQEKEAEEEPADEAPDEEA